MTGAQPDQPDRRTGQTKPPGGAAGPVLAVEDLSVEFRTPGGVVPAVRGISYELAAGETLAIVGESGSGKTVSAHALLGIVDSPPGFVTSGHAYFHGEDLLALPEAKLRRIRGRHITLVVQDALSSLNPVLRVGQQVADMYRRHAGLSKKEAWRSAVAMMGRVHIPEPADRAHSYPHELSGGMRQRVMIAMAVAMEPDVLVADEPTTSLDVTIQAQILQLLAELQAETGMGLILITHDLAVVAEVAHRVAVMYAGKLVETAPVVDLFQRPAHPYTAGLVASVPRVDRRPGALVAIEGRPPDPNHLPAGCSFHPRCAAAGPICHEHEPMLVMGRPGRTCACHFAEASLGD